MVSARQTFALRMWKALVLAIFVLYSLAQVFGATEFAGAVPHTTNILGYQGRLLNSNGVPVADTSASMIFELYTLPSGGSCVWSNSSATCATATSRTVTLSDGLFSESLGDTGAASPYAAIGDEIFADNAALYLQVTVNGEPLLPRKRILASAYALNSQTLDGYNTTTTGGTSSAVTVLDSNGNLQLTGSPQGTGAGQGSLYINPAGGVVSANEVLFGVAVAGSSRFTLDAEGDAVLAGQLTVSGGVIDSASAITIASSGGNISFAPSGSGLAFVTAGDDFAVGGTSLVAPFSIDESLNTVRIGDGVNDANDPSIVFYASDATDSGTLSYADDDRLSLANGNFIHSTVGSLPTTASAAQRDHLVTTNWTGTSNANLSGLDLYTLSGTANYSAIENATNTDHMVVASEGLLQISGASTTLTNGHGVLGYIINTSTNASLVQGTGHLAAVRGAFFHNAAVTLPTAYGVRGGISVASGTVNDAYATAGIVEPSAGTITRGYGGYFSNTTSGATRYGILATASGGATANFSGYFSGARVQIDDDATPNAPNFATGVGDLFVTDGLEVDGELRVGDTTGTDVFTFTSAATTQNASMFAVDSLTTGRGLYVLRANNGSDFDGELLTVTQSDNGATSDGDALVVKNDGGGDAIGVYISQAQITDETNGAGGTTLGAQALVLETAETASNDDIMLVTANGQITLAIESDGSILSDNAYSSAGADYAEYFATADATLADSEVVCQDHDLANAVKRCEAGNTAIVGVVSPTPGFVGGLPDFDDTGLHAIVGLNGQVDTFATAEDGPIAIGDAVTTSQVRAGYVGLAEGPDRILGFALEALSSGTGTIKVYVNPQWYGGDVLTNDGSAIVSSEDVLLASLRVADASTQAVASRDLVLRGSVWSDGAANDADIRLRANTDEDRTRLSVVSGAGSEAAFIGNNGDIALAGKLYPSDRGVMQTSKYIYYDGADGFGGDMMRTNAAGWSSGSYDFAEMFPSRDVLAPGEVVVFADSKEEIRRSSGTPYDDRIAGVISTSPAFLAGENRVGDVPVALAGRVPTYVSGENGAIAVGDPLTTSTKAGYAMKATQAGPIIGYAMDAFSGNTGVIVVFIRPSYYDGGPVDDAPIANNTASSVANIATLDVSGSLNMNGGSILSVASLMGIGQQWRIQENGDIFTRGRVVQIVTSYAGEDVETYASTSRAQTISLSGTAVLQNGEARVLFEREDAAFNDIIANEVGYRVYLTPAGMTGMLAAVDRTMEGFRIQEAGTSDGVSVDWFVVAYHKDHAPTVLPEEVVDAVSDVVVEAPQEQSAPEADSPEGTEQPSIDEQSIIDPAPPEEQTPSIEHNVAEDMVQEQP